MQKMKIRYIGDPVLSAIPKKIETITEELFLTSREMIDTMHKLHGIGLAGNQVGLLQRIVVIDIDFPEDDEGKALPIETPGEEQLLPLMPITLINPEIISFSDDQCDFDEGCLSIPKIYANVRRSRKVILKTKLLDGREIVAECGGLLARVLQHELDHLNGHIFLERVTDKDMVPVALDVKKLLKRYAPKHFEIRKIQH